MLCVFFFTFMLILLAGVYLNCSRLGNLFLWEQKAFLRCSCVHLFFAFAITFRFANKIHLFSKRRYVIRSWGKWGRHSFVNRYVLNLTMQNHFDVWWSCHRLRIPSKTWDEETQWTEPLLKRGEWGGQSKTRPSMLVFGQCAVANLHSLQHL